MPEKRLYHYDLRIADRDFNPNNHQAVTMWLESFQGHEFGFYRHFYPNHFYHLETQRVGEPISLTFYTPTELSSGPIFNRRSFKCRVFTVVNRYGRSIRAELPVGGKQNWAEFFGHLNRAILPFKLRCE